MKILLAILNATPGLILIFWLGTVIGSFLNVLIYRLPREISIVKPGSFCPLCKTPIPFYRNIPLFSYLLQRGRCWHCGNPISVRYPLVELLSGLAWLWSFAELPPDEALLFVWFFSILLVISFIDYSFYLIPTSLILAGFLCILVGLFLQVFSWRQVLAGAFFLEGILLFVYFLVWLLFQKRGLGGGDFLLGLLCGAFLGPYLSPFLLIMASGTGLIFYLMRYLFEKQPPERFLPFAPFISMGAITVYLLNFYYPGLFEWVMV